MSPPLATGRAGLPAGRPVAPFGRPTLEDVFVRLTGRRLEAAGAEAPGSGPMSPPMRRTPAAITTTTTTTITITTTTTALRPEAAR